MHKMWKMFKFLPKKGFSIRIKGKDKNDDIKEKVQGDRNPKNKNDEKNKIADSSFPSFRYIVVIITFFMALFGIIYLLCTSYFTAKQIEDPNERVPFKFSHK